MQGSRGRGGVHTSCKEQPLSGNTQCIIEQPTKNAFEHTTETSTDKMFTLPTNKRIRKHTGKSTDKLFTLRWPENRTSKLQYCEIPTNRFLKSANLGIADPLVSGTRSVKPA